MNRAHVFPLAIAAGVIVGRLLVDYVDILHAPVVQRASHLFAVQDHGWSREAAHSLRQDSRRFEGKLAFLEKVITYCYPRKSCDAAAITRNWIQVMREGRLGEKSLLEKLPPEKLRGYQSCLEKERPMGDMMNDETFCACTEILAPDMEGVKHPYEEIWGTVAFSMFDTASVPDKIDIRCGARAILYGGLSFEQILEISKT